MGSDGWALFGTAMQLPGFVLTHHLAHLFLSFGLAFHAEQREVLLRAFLGHRVILLEALGKAFVGRGQIVTAHFPDIRGAGWAGNDEQGAFWGHTVDIVNGAAVGG